VKGLNGTFLCNRQQAGSFRSLIRSNAVANAQHDGGMTSAVMRHADHNLHRSVSDGATI
jgi:hypothetical protein